MRLKLNLPDKDTIAAGLTLDDCHPPLPRARAALADAESGLEDARQRLRDAETEAAATPGRVRAGTHTRTDLEAAITTAKAAALEIPAAERAVADAQRRVEAERIYARNAIEQETERRTTTLQAIADEVAPVLESLTAAEAAVNQALRGALLGKLGADGRPLEAGVPTLEWPRSRSDAMRSAVLMQRRHRRVVA